MVGWTLGFEKIIHTGAYAIPSSVQPPLLELKPLSVSLKYIFLGTGETFPVVISSSLTKEQETALLEVLHKYRQAIGWTIDDVKGIDSSV